MSKVVEKFSRTTSEEAKKRVELKVGEKGLVAALKDRD